MLDIREKLSVPGKILKILDVGFGDTTVFDGQSHPDVMWGAKPEVLGLKPIGGTITWELEWRCTFNITECDFAKDHWFAFNYKTDYSYDDIGFCTRTISGYIQLPVTPNTDRRKVTETADRLRDRITILTPSNFKRVSSNWSINEDKSIIEFSAVDAELQEDPYPPGIRQMDIDYTIENTAIGFSAHVVTITGSMETMPGYPRNLSARAFFLIVFEKLKSLRANYVKKGGKGESAQGAQIIPQKLKIQHKPGTRKSSFVMSFRLTRCIRDILSDQSIWEPLPQNKYHEWKNSIDRINGWGNRGLARLRQQPGEDRVVDLCDKRTSATIGNDFRVSPLFDYTDRYSSVFSCEEVTEESSWVFMETQTRIIQDNQVVTHKPAQAIEYKKTAPADLKDKESTLSAQVAKKASSASSPGTEPLPDIVENTCRPTQTVLLQGRAARLKYRIPPQEIKRVGGHDVTEKARDFIQEERGWFFGCPLYIARWWILMEVPNGYADKIKTQSNPKICSTDTKGIEI
jgi:hypothetical protein